MQDIEKDFEEFVQKEIQREEEYRKEKSIYGWIAIGIASVIGMGLLVPAVSSGHL